MFANVKLFLFELFVMQRARLTMLPQKIIGLLIVIFCISACSSDNNTANNASADDNTNGNQNTPNQTPSALDTTLLALIENEGLTGNAANNRNLPDINDPLAQLGKSLFFAKNLGGQQDAACVSCHHPVLGGGDNLSLPVGVDAVNNNDIASANLLGLGRFHASNLPPVPRNAPTVFNAGLWDQGMFWDSRVERLDGNPNSNGTNAGIITPDSANTTTADANLPANISLANAQARFPVTSIEEMRGNFSALDDNQALRSNLATRFATNANWQSAFQNAFGDSTITFDRIALAIAAYERSMVFTSNAFSAYIEGDLSALDDEQKQGGILFYTAVENNGGGCSRCHSGDFFTDEQHHVIGFPQIGPGKGNGATADNDFGRENVSGDSDERFHFRTPSLLNIAVTAPYGHTGAYATLDEVMRHYNNPAGTVNDFFGTTNGGNFGQGDFCDLPQIVDIIEKTNETCTQVYNDLNPNAIQNTTQALAFINNPNAASSLSPVANLNNNERDQITAFLHALTDPCVENRNCLDDWIVDQGDELTFPDALPLIATDEFGTGL